MTRSSQQIGTRIHLEIKLNSRRTCQEVFRKIFDQDGKMVRIPVNLVRSKNEQVNSRIQAQSLLHNLKDLTEIEFDFQNIADQCKNFIEIAGNAGDMFIIHPFMLHASSQNHSQIPRVISNPPIILKEPLNLDPDSVNHSLLEKATLNYIQGRNWVQPKPEKRSSYWWVID